MAVFLACPSAASTLTEGPIEPFLGPPALTQTRLFSSQRFPNVVVTKTGAVLAVWGQTTVQARRSADGGATWSAAVNIRAGIHGGGATVDENSGDILTFVEEEHPPATLHILRSQDDGLTWSPQNFTILPNSQGHVPAMHMNEHGTTLRHGAHVGRLIRPTRWYGASNYPAGEWPTHYTNAMFSDDGGLTWQASEAFPQMGTGEACIVELADGRLHYNTRRHWAATSADSLWRWSATSSDGGLTWTDAWKSSVLPDGNTNSTYGLMGGLVRLPVAGRDILLFSNVVNNSTRANGHVWASFDGGLTWPLRRSVFTGSFAYSAMHAGRPGTPSQGWVYLFYEGGPEGGGTMARFNLSWLLDGGQLTGDGALPEWIDYNPVTPPANENPGAALWAFEETPAGQALSTAPDAIRDLHPAGHKLHLTATAAFPVVAGAPAFGNGRAIAITGNGGARILDDASANRFDFGPNDSFTLEVVCRIPNGSTQVGALLAKDLGPTSPSWWLRVENGKARFLVSDSTRERVFSSTANINTGQWHHIAAVRDASNPAARELRLFIDGQLSGTLADTTTGTFANGNALWIGRFNSGSRLLTGDIDLVRITPQALAPAAFVTENPTDYAMWAATHNLTGGPTDDADGDGLSNFEEYAFGLDPSKGISGSPVIAPNKTAGTFTYTRRKPSLTGLTYACESSTTLGGWSTFTPVSEISNHGDPVETLTVTLPAALLDESALFLRVKAAEP
jgi:sialidase-1